jgi:thymidine kinase
LILNKNNKKERKMGSKIGSVEAIYGSMFSGKTEEMLRRLRRAMIAKNKVKVFRSAVDTRGEKDKISSHDKNKFEAETVESSTDILARVGPDVDVVGIDEAQFFDSGIVEVIEELAKDGKRVIVNGLSLDFRGDPFGSMPIIIVKADKADLIPAICMVCGKDATRTQRIVNGKPARRSDPQIVIGAAEAYEARCRLHHEVPD